MTLEIKDCYKKYNDKLVFENISYKFENKIYWLKGSNGIGKSVLLRCLTNIEKFTGGTIQSDKKNILYIPEFSLNEDWLTLRENVKLLMYYHKLHIDDEKLSNILYKLNMGDCNILPTKASLGTNIKTSLALLFVEKYWDLIIIDEALAHIDNSTKSNIIRELARRCDENATVILTHHGEFMNEKNKLDIKEIFLDKGGLR